jgi:hypothetical protein
MQRKINNLKSVAMKKKICSKDKSYGQNAELLVIKPDGTYSYHWDLRG